MNWDAEGLLEGLEDDAARDARRRLLDELHAGGMELEELRRTVAEDKLVLAPVAGALSSEPRYTGREIAAVVAARGRSRRRRSWSSAS
jgi:adenylate cyclase